MRINVSHADHGFDSYRANRVKSLFNADKSAFELTAELPIEGIDWRIGLVVGPSGSGKTSIGQRVFPRVEISDLYSGWRSDQPIVDAIAPGGSFDEVTHMLSAVGLGDVPAWLRPFSALSNGQKFRAGLARELCGHSRHLVIDEFTSVVDRQIAKIGALAFSRTFKRQEGRQAVLLSCHYDVIEWLQPDWIYDTKEARFSRDCLRRPRLDLQIWKVRGTLWKLFKEHYYLDLPHPVASEYYVGVVNGELVCHLAVCPLFTAKAYRATRLVVMPEWQGSGIGTKFLEAVCQLYLEGKGRCGHKFPTFFHTSHPQLCAYLRRAPKWVQTSAQLYGTNKGASAASIHKTTKQKEPVGSGYGGHFRAIQGFKYIGE